MAPLARFAASNTVDKRQYPFGPGGSGGPVTLRRAVAVFWSYPQPVILLACFGAALSARVALAPCGWHDLAIVMGMLLWWPFQEWLLHVRILHSRPFKVPGGRMYQLYVARKHTFHHGDPWRIDVVFLPMITVLASVVVIPGFWWLAMPRLEWAFTGMALFYILALNYEWTHYLIHVPYRPKTAWFRRLWVSHRLHHFKNEHYWYGVSMLFGDIVLRTHPDKNSVPTSPTARTLGREAEA